jgi:protease-4
MTHRRSWLGEILRGLFHLLDVTRRVVFNLVFLVLMVLLIAWMLDDRTPEVPEKAALRIAPRGPLVDQLTGDPEARLVEWLLDAERPETLLRDQIEAIGKARNDERIVALVLDLDRLGGTGMSHLADLAAAVTDFRVSGKPVVATSDFYGRSSFYLAAHADEVFLHQDGIVAVEGFGRFRTYYRDGLERLGVDANVFRVGAYKSAVEPYLRDDMSPEAKEANLDWLGDLWESYQSGVTTARGLDAEALTDFIDGLDSDLAESGGDLAQLALDAGLVDHLGGRDAFRDRMVELVGEDDESHSYSAIGAGAYLRAVGRDRPRGEAGQIGVIVARGSILDGSHPPGTIGGDSTAALVRSARHDERVEAIVLRVDSSGGSVFASEIIRRELELAREAGKPVVVSMANVAASGGYYIALASDEIWASPDTITGSIGVFALFPTFQRPLEKYLGMRVDGVGTTWLSGGLRPDRELDPRLGDVIQLVVDGSYREFVGKVAAARSMTVEEVEVVAGGRVWSGRDAHEIGLVDRLGGLEQAIRSAARLAELGDDPEVRYIERRRSFRESLAASLAGRALIWLEAAGAASPGLAGSTSLERRLRRELERLTPAGRPFGLYSHCFCEIE